MCSHNQLLPYICINDGRFKLYVFSLIYRWATDLKPLSDQSALRQVPAVVPRPRPALTRPLIATSGQLCHDVVLWFPYDKLRTILRYFYLLIWVILCTFFFFISISLACLEIKELWFRQSVKGQYEWNPKCSTRLTISDGKWPVFV